MQPDAEDLKKWHRFFAIEANNSGWSLSVKERSEVENQQLLDFAHTAAHHWGIVGETANQMSAKMLLAEVHCLAGCSELAFAYANEMRGYFVAQQTDPWELALAHGIFAHAAHLTNQTDLYEVALAETTKALNMIESKEDKDIVLETLVHIPGFSQTT